MTMARDEECNEAEVEQWRKRKPGTCHATVITAPYVKHCEKRETEKGEDRQRKKATTLKN